MQSLCRRALLPLFTGTFVLAALGVPIDASALPGALVCELTLRLQSAEAVGQIQWTLDYGNAPVFLPGAGNGGQCSSLL